MCCTYADAQFEHLLMTVQGARLVGRYREEQKVESLVDLQLLLLLQRHKPKAR